MESFCGLSIILMMNISTAMATGVWWLLALVVMLKWVSCFSVNDYSCLRLLANKYVQILCLTCMQKERVGRKLVVVQ